MNRMIRLCYALASMSAGLQAAEWAPVTPGPGSGIRQLKATQNHLYALSSTGLWRCARSGGAWSPVHQPAKEIYSFWSNDTISMVSFKNYYNPNYDATTESHVSTDDAATWNQVQYMPQFMTAYGKLEGIYVGASTYTYNIDYGPHVDSRCCESSSDFHIAHDPAQRWYFRAKIHEELNRYLHPFTTSLAVMSKSITALMLTEGSGFPSKGSLYLSSDTGMTWSELPFGATTVTQLLQVDTVLYATADSGTLYSSKNGGWAWDTLGTPAGNKVGDAILAEAEGRVFYVSGARAYPLEGDSLDWAGIETHFIPAGVSCMVFFDGKLWAGTGEGIYTYPIREVSTQLRSDARKPSQRRLRAQGIFTMPDDSQRGLNGRLKP